MLLLIAAVAQELTVTAAQELRKYCTQKKKKKIQIKNK